MINLTHLKVLLKKDFLTLRRNVGFIIAFILLPIALSGAFIGIQTAVDNGTNNGDNMLEDHFRYTSSMFFNYPQGLYTVAPFAGMQVLPASEDPFRIIASTLQKCTQQNNAKYYFSKIAVVAPDEDVRKNAVQYMTDYFLVINKYPSNYTVDGFASQDEVFDKVKTQDKQPYCFGLTFNKFDTTNDDYDIEFSFNNDASPDTNQQAFNQQVKAPDFASWDSWFNNGVVAIYPYIMEFIARSKQDTPDFSKATALYNQELGYAPMKSVPFQDVSPLAAQQLSQNYPFFFMIIELIPFYYLTSKIASEKESKAREGMKMMGLNDTTYHLSWFIFYGTIQLGTAIIMTLASLGIFQQVNAVLFFFFSLFYGLTLYGWAFSIVSFLPTKRSSGIAATLLHVISFYLSFLIMDPSTPSGAQYGLSILPNVCMNQIVKQIFFYDLNTRDGLTWSTLSIEYQNYSFRGGLLMLFGDVIFWGVLGLYLDQVVPSQFGVAKPWNFCCKRRQQKVQGSGEMTRLLDEESPAQEDPTKFEPVSDSLKKQEKSNECLRVKGLVKEFGEKKAVNNTSLTMYNGQIFALLGHNGAGKTTTISMLTGLLEPTAGRADVFGIDIFSEMDEMRKILGVCPQHDVLFDFLTPEDHLRLFASFKGTPVDEIEPQVQQMLLDIDLGDVKTQMSKTLSGGQKRKLSVAIAMIGNSKIVMLDEPTSGMDTSARRRLWEMLKKNKNGRIVILTTHYMDEADILGDRIAIMAEGKVQCTGSSLFLKNKYGVGYNLVIAKKDRQPGPRIDEFIQSRIPEAKKMQEVSSEIAYQLPTSSSQLFKQFFAEFDQNLDNLNIRSYGVGITTLEEVFLKIGHGEEEEPKDQFDKEGDIQKETSSHINLSKDVENGQSLMSALDKYSIATDSEQSVFFLHLWALLKKKILMQIRDKKTLSIDTIFPVILIIAGLALSTVAFFKDGQGREMTPFIFPSPLKFYYNEESQMLNTDTEIVKFFDQAIKGQNASNIEIVGGRQIKLEAGKVLENAKQYDDQIFDSVQQDQVPTYGQFYLYNLYHEQMPQSAYSGILILNSTSQTAAGSWGKFGNEAFLRHYLASQGKLSDNFNLKITDQPFPLSQTYQALIKTISGTNSAILMTIAWMMISDSLVQNIIKERQRNIKHQIMISGSSLGAYWLGHYIGDIIFQALPAVVGIIGVHAFGIDVPQVEYLFLVTIFANPAFVYFFSFLFEKDETGSLVIKMLYFVLGIIAPIAVSVLLVINSTTNNIASILRWFFYPFPIYSLTYGYMAIAEIQIIQIATGSPVAPKPLSKEVAGYSLIFLSCAIPFYWLLVYMIEMKFFDILFCRRGQRGGEDGIERRRSSIFKAHMEANPNQADEDIEEEERRVEGMSPDQLPVRVEKVQKRYGNVQAVKSISFGLEFGECFALLGVSGAGKTSIFKCLTGEIYPTRGNLSITGFDVTTTKGFEVARKQIGYCPQFDAIFEGLTVLEHLRIYAALKGIKTEFREQIVQKTIREMDLESYVATRANNLSGGNKRKLSVAMAILGNPPLVFLDEPSTGVDPQAKRFMWNIISKISTQRKQSAVIITTHSMEEAEALCTKMGIMVSGLFKCFGSSQHIKNKYGTGYEIEVKIKTLKEPEVKDILAQLGFEGQNKLSKEECVSILQRTTPELIEEIAEDGVGDDFHATFALGSKVDADEFIRWQLVESQGNKTIDYLQRQFQELTLLEHYGNSFRLKVSRDNYSIGFLFGMMEDIQTQFDISEYSVAQTTLEQIFNNFALQAEEEDGKQRRGSSFRKRKSSKKQRRSTAN